METAGEIGGGGAGHEVAVGVVPRRQLDDAGGHADIGEASCKPMRGVLASLVFILIEDKWQKTVLEPAATRLGKLTFSQQVQLRIGAALNHSKSLIYQFL